MVRDTITARQRTRGPRSGLLFGLGALLLVLIAPSPAAARLPDRVAVTAQACTLTGDGGANSLSGTRARDVVCARGGADRVRGNGGHDILLGGAGADLLQGKTGSDRLDGGPGNDRAFGGAGADDIRGGSGNDILGGGLGPDGLSGGSGRDIVVYGQRGLRVTVTIGAGANDGLAGERDNIKADVESVQSGRGNDVLTGSGGSNRLFGGGGKDRLIGKGGSDVLMGADGDDSIDAREGATAAGRAAQAGAVDRVVCGAGNDTALVDPVDLVDASCENVVGGATPPSGGQPPAGNQPPGGNQPPPGSPNRAPTGIDLSDDTVNENEPRGTSVGTFSASDPDSGDTHAFALVPGAGSADNSSFEIDGSTLKTAEEFDFETQDTYLIRVSATDNGAPAMSVEAEFEVTVTDTNEPPTAINDSAAVGEDSGAGAIAVLANDTDSDGGAMAIASASDPANGTVVLTGGLPGAHTGLTYQPDPNYCNSPPGTTPDTFTYTLNGGDSGTVSVTVTCAEDLPTAGDDATTVPEDSAATPVAVLDNDNDPDGDTPTIASASDPAHGTVVLTGGLPGARTGLTYEPEPNYCNSQAGGAPDTFTYTLNGGVSATVSVTVTCGDDAPTAVDDTATVGEDSAAGAIAVLTNDTDTDGGAMTIASASDPANGTVVLTGGSAGAHTGLTYQPDSNYCSATPDTFTYTLNGGSTATVSVTVTCVDDPPTAVDDSATVGEDTAASAINVLANDTDTDGGPKSVASVIQPANGTVVITGGGTGLTYQPAPNYCGADSFAYTLNGGDSADVSVTVTCVDDAPTAVNDSKTVAEDAAATDVDVLANDTDVDGGPRSVSAVTQSTNGTVAITGGGTGLTYRPNVGYCNDPPGTSPDTFTYTLNGGSTATVSVTVTCNDDAPTAVDDSSTVAEDSGATAVDVLGNDPDTDGGPRSVASVTQPANGTVVITGGGSGLTYQPNANFCSATPDSFTYTLNGGDSATVSVTVTCVDDAPTAVADSATVVEDSGAAARDVLANDLNADGGPVTIATASDPAHGTVVVTGGGTGLTYQPDANYCGADSFTYTLGGGSQATVSMTVTCAPDDPVVDTSAGSVSYTENANAVVIDAAVTVSDVDAPTTITGATVRITGGYAGAQDILALAGTHTGITATLSGDTLTLTGDASVAAYQAALRAVTYRNDSENPSTAARTVTFAVTDEATRTGSDTKAVTVTAVDDPPVAVADSATVLEDAAATAITVLTNDTDVDAGPRSIASVTQPTNGTVVITGGGTGLTYLPNANYCNSPPGTTLSTFTYTLNGGSSATVSVTVTCVNDVPVADDETFNGANSAVGNTSLVVNDPDDGAPALSSPKKSIAGDILAGDSDIDGPGPLAVVAGTFTTNDGGSVTLEADGDFIYRPAAGTSCTDTSDFFDYTLSDQNTAGPGPTPGTDIGRVTIAIAGCVWYVNNNDTNGNSGTSTAPFDTLTQAENASAANHTVFVFDGDNTSTGYDGNGYTMNAGERLIGEHEGLIVGTDTLHPANPGMHPTVTVTTPGADVIDLDDGNEVRGLNIDPLGAGGGIAGSTGDVSATIDDVNINDTGTFGTQPGLELDGTTGTFAVSNLTVNTNGATGVRLNNAGTVTFAAASNISITSANAAGLVATGGGATGVNLGTSEFDAITVTGSGTGGVSLTNTTGNTTFGDLALTTTSGATAAFGLSNAGTVSFRATGTQNVSATGGPAVDITGTSVSTVAFEAVSSTNSTADGINLAGVGAGTFTATSGTITGAGGIAFDLDGGSGTVTYPGTIGNGQGSTAEITGRTGSGTVTLSGPITETGDTDTTAENGGIAVTGNSGGSTVVSNATKTFNTGEDHAIVIGTSDGHTLTLSGGTLDIDTTSGQGISANNSGTIVVSGAGNTIDSTSATALNITNTDIGTGGATFQRISSGNNTPADADPANGIVLNNTGATGLTVTGGGSTAQGGDNSGGTIQSTTGHGISLTNTTSPSFRNMQLLNTGDSGVNGTQTNGFSFTDGKITGAGDASDENSITFDDSLTATPNLTGAVTVTNNVISQTEAEGVDIENWGGTISNANISGNALSDTPDVATPGSAVTLIGSGTPTSAANITRATVSNNTIVDFRAGVGVQVRAGNPTAGAPTGSAGTAGSATNVIDITGNSMNGGNAGIGNQPDRFFTGGVSGNGGQGNFNVSNNGTAANRLRNIDCIAIEMQVDGPVTMTSTVQNNFINANSAVGCAGIAVGTDDPSDLGAGTHSTLISGNNVMGTDGQGIFAIVRDSASTMTARVLNNTVAAPIANAARSGIQASSGSAQGDTTLCLEITGNTTAGSTNTDTGTRSPGIALRKQGTDPTINTFGIEGMTATASPGVENYVNALNTSASGTFGVGGTTLLSAQSGFTNCTAP